MEGVFQHFELCASADNKIIQLCMSEKAFGHTCFTKKMLLGIKFWLTEPSIQGFKDVSAVSSDCIVVVSVEKSATLVFVALYEVRLFSLTAPKNFSIINFE